MPKRIAQTLIFFLLTLPLGAANITSLSAQAQNQPASALGQPTGLAEKLAKIEKEIEEKRKELGVPGVAVAIVKDDRVIFQKGFGLRDVEHNLPVTADTLFAIASCTKSFTAMAAVISQDAGKLSLDDSPKKHLSYFRLQDPEADTRITVRDLLIHSSGLAVRDLVSSTGVLNRSEVIKVAGLAKPTAKFREKFQYQNIMYSAAGEVVAKANGTTWEKFIEERVFKPLGMKSSYPSLKQMVRVTNHATGYWLENKVATKVVFASHAMANIAAAGAITSNVIDLSQWIRLMLGGGVLDGKRFVSERGFSEIVKRHITVDDNFGVPPYLPGAGYGLGWFLADRNGHHFIYHPGGINGFTSLVELVPDQKLGFVLLTNASSNRGLALISEVVFDNIVGKPQTLAENTESVPPQSDIGESAALAGPASFATIDITVDELMAKALAAAGGEANLRRHRSTTGSATLDFENQGLTGKIAVYSQAPNLSATITTIVGLGKKIASQREYFDGAQGGVERSPGEGERYNDEQLESTRISSDYYEQLNWKKLYKTVTIKEKSKVADEEVYVVVKTPEKGNAISDYISAKSFLVVKRASEGTSEETIYSDYRNVDGEMVPFCSVVQGGEMGRIVSKVQEVKFNVNIPASTLRPAAN
jgi:CubicO group peptidase (beta-lactamase class C family)